MFSRPSQGTEGNGLPTRGLPPRPGQPPTGLQAPEGRALPVPPWCRTARQRNNVTTAPIVPGWQVASQSCCQHSWHHSHASDANARWWQRVRPWGLGVGFPASGAGRKKGTEFESQKGKCCLCATLLCVHTSHIRTKQRSGCANPNFHTWA